MSRNAVKRLQRAIQPTIKFKTMSTLLPIESAYIEQFTYEGGSLSRLHTLQATELDLDKQKFDKSLAQAEQVRAALAKFESDEGKAAMAAAGLTWTKTEFCEKGLRYQDRSFVNKMVRVATRNDEHPSLITKYKREQSRLAADGAKAPRSIVHFDKWSRELLEQADESGESVEDVAEGAEVEATTASAPQMAQFRFKHPIHGNIVVNIDEAGDVQTTNTGEQIAESMLIFKSIVDAWMAQ